jgi:hypothetical protein
MDPEKLYKRVLAAGICLCLYWMGFPTEDNDGMYTWIRPAAILGFAVLCLVLRRRIPEDAGQQQQQAQQQQPAEWQQQRGKKTD